MSLGYDRLWLRLNERGLTIQDLKQGTGLSSATVARLRKNLDVRASTLDRVCDYLDCSLEQIAVKAGSAEQGEEFDYQRNDLRLNSFFSGIGGFELGFEPEGFSTEFQCEIDGYCRDVLARHWPTVPRATDVSKVDPALLPDADVWVAGFPCQDISVARGKSTRLGLNGDRSGLFHDFARLVAAREPSVVVLENVSGLLNSNQGRDFGYILQHLTALGYSVAWRVLNSRYFGVPQSRPRTYLVGWRGDVSAAAGSLFESERVPTPKNQRHEFVEVGSRPGAFPVVPKISYCLAATSGRHTGTDWSRTYVVCSEGVRRMTPLEYERLQGFPDRWTIPSADVASEEIDTLRYKAVGNAVSVPVIRWIAARISKEMCRTVSLATTTSDDIQVSVPSLSKGQRLESQLADIDFSDSSVSWKWLNSGVATREYVLHATTSPSPVEPFSSNLAKLVEREPLAGKYYLTPNAAEGILRRCGAQGRTLFEPLDKALKALAGA